MRNTNMDRSLRTLRAAAILGIVFALLLTTALAFVRRAMRIANLLKV